MTNFNEKKPVFISLIRLGIALGIIYYLLTEYFFENIILFISSTKLGYLVCAGILSIIFLMLISTRLKLLAEFQEIPIALHSVFKIKLVAAFYGLFLPAKNLTGGAIVFYELSKVNNKKAEALASIILDRVLATIALCLVGGLFWSMDRTHVAANFGFNLIFVFGIFLIVVIVFINVRILNPLSKFLEIFNLPSLNRSLSKFHESLLKYRNIPAKSLAFILILSIFYHFLEVLVYYLLTKSLGLNVIVVISSQKEVIMVNFVGQILPYIQSCRNICFKFISKLVQENAKLWSDVSKKYGALIVIIRFQISQGKYTLYSVYIFFRLRACIESLRV